MFDFVTDPFESIRPQEGSSCPVSLMPTERDQVACRSKLHAETKFHSLVKAGEGQAGALDSTPSPQASGGAAFQGSQQGGDAGAAHSTTD